MCDLFCHTAARACVDISSIVRMLAPELSGCDMMWEVTPAEPAQACLFSVDASLILL